MARGGLLAHEGGSCSLSVDPGAVARLRGPRIPTPSSQARGPARLVLRRAAAPRAVMHVRAVAPPCSSLSAAPGTAAHLATMETDWALPQIRPNAATMCFGSGSSVTLQLLGPARRVCNSCAASPGRELAERSCDAAAACSALPLLLA